MRHNPVLKLIRARTVQNKFNIIIGLIVVIILFSLTDFWFGIKVMSGIRGYVGGEGLWSKAQKEAVNSLILYAHSGDDLVYDHYLALLRIQAGDKRARLELDKANPNYAIIRDGFVQGGNDPADIDDMTFLYRQFHQVSYMKSAIQTWRQGDAEMINLESLGAQAHALVNVIYASPEASATAAQSAELATLTKQIHIVDDRLTILENRFSATLGNGSRNISNALLRLTIFTTVMLGLLTVVVAMVISKALIRLDKSKTEFVSLASHQLRTPLTAIKWYTEALLSGGKGPLNASQREYMQELAHGGRRMSELINDILKVSSLDLGTYKSETRLIGVDEILQTVIKDLRPVIEHKHLQLALNVDPNLPRTEIDDQLVTATFQNLISNSVKYTPNNGWIVVDAERHKHNLAIHVGDSGIGIPEAQQSQIFRKLFRADNAKQLDDHGSGLGLYIVRALADRVGGSVWFTSTEGKGSDFYVTLPMYRGSHGRSNN